MNGESFLTLAAEARAPVLNQPRLGKALLLAISCFVALFLCEALTRVVYRRSKDLDMEMWRYATQLKTVSADPQVGFEHLPNRSTYLMGVDVRTNSYGLRGAETTLEKPTNTYRILVLGDSFTFGWGVSEDQTYPNQVERMLNNQAPRGLPKGVHYEVLNLGVGNYNTVQEVARLRNIGLQFDPDLILLGYFINDAEPLSSPRHGFLLEHSYLYAFLASRGRVSPLGDFGTRSYKEYYRDLYAADQPGWQAAKSALAELVEIGRRRNTPVAVYLLPDLHDLGNYPFANIHQELIRLGQDIRLPVIDLLGPFKGYSPENLWVSPTDVHPNSTAQTLIARAIYESLTVAAIKPPGLATNTESKHDWKNRSDSRMAQTHR